MIRSWAALLEIICPVLGGMGIILLFVAILPRLGVAGRQLYRAEVPGPDKESIKPRIKQTARMLWMSISS